MQIRRKFLKRNRLGRLHPAEIKHIASTSGTSQSTPEKLWINANEKSPKPGMVPTHLQRREEKETRESCQYGDCHCRQMRHTEARTHANSQRQNSKPNQTIFRRETNMKKKTTNLQDHDVK